MRSDSDPAQIESVRVPTGLNCDVAFCLSRSVKRTGDPEEFKIFVWHLEKFASQLRCKSSTTATMSRVVALVGPSGVVEDGEQSHDL